MKFVNNTNQVKEVAHDGRKYSVEPKSDFEVDDSNQELIDAFKEVFSVSEKADTKEDEKKDEEKKDEAKK